MKKSVKKVAKVVEYNGKRYQVYCGLLVRVDGCNMIEVDPGMGITKEDYDEVIKLIG